MSALYQTQCDLFCDESSRIASTISDHGANYQDFVVETPVDVEAGTEGSLVPNHNHEAMDIDGSGFPSDGEVHEADAHKTENIASLGTYRCGFLQPCHAKDKSFCV